MQRPLDHQRDLIFSLRPYQQQVLDEIADSIQKGSKKYHLIAPPGSGKTIIGLAALFLTRSKGVIFSPNNAIQAQWVKRFEESTDHINSTALDDSWMSPVANSGATFLSLTYQSVAIRDLKSNGNHENAQATIDQLIAGNYRVLVLDECHHITGFWGEVIEHIIEQLDDPFIISLTATPPIEVAPKALNRYLRIAGPVRKEIPLPAVVRQGDLAPYQDLVYFTHPGEDELDQLEAADQELNTLLNQLETPEYPRQRLANWIYDCLDQSKYRGEILPFPDWMRKHPDAAIAYVRYLKRAKLEPPINAIWIDEMASPCDTDDLALVLADFRKYHLEPLKGTVKDLIQNLDDVMGRLGFRFSRSNYQSTNSGTARALTLSRSKLVGLQEILRQELGYQMDSMRALVLVDYEFGREGCDGITAIDVMDAVTHCDDVDQLDPIMITGRSLLIDDDFLEPFIALAAAYRKRRALKFELISEPEQGYFRVSGNGPDWNTRIRVSLITEIFESGLSRLLISTRSLLGEGWDSQSLNTLVDLTAISAFVSVNQIRGRSIRKDPQMLTKCANNWDIVTIAPGTGFGLHDLHRLEAKHAQFYGVSDDGVIEKGLGHIHPLLGKGRHTQIAPITTELNSEMLDRASQRDIARELWKVGTPYRNTDMHCLEIQPESVRPAQSTRSQYMWIEEVKINLEESRPQYRLIQLLTSIAGTLPGALLFWTLQNSMTLAISALGSASAIILCHQQRQKEARHHLEEAERQGNKSHKTILSFAYALLATLRELDQISRDITCEAIELLERKNGFYRIVLHGSTEAESKVFSESLYEVLGPYQNNKYIIERQQISVELTGLSLAQILGKKMVPFDTIACHPVPFSCSRKKADVQIFQKFWNQYVSPGRTYYTRQGSGKEFAQAWFMKNPVELKRSKKIVWE